MKRREETLKSLQRCALQQLRDKGRTWREDNSIYERSIDQIQARQILHRIDRGLYGVCIDCEKAIPLVRLKVKPDAIRCIRCQSIYEQRPTIRGASVKGICIDTPVV